MLLIIAGALTQLIGTATLILALASLPVLHDLHSGTHSLIASIIAALAAVICGTLAYRGRLIPLALAAGLDVGSGIGLPRGSSAIGALLRILPKNDADTADTLVTIGAVAMFVAAIFCVIAIPTALSLRRWARAELAREARGGGQTDPGKPSASTLKGFGPSRLIPTQVIKLPRAKPVVIIAVSAALIAIGIVVIGASSGGSQSSDPKLGSGVHAGSAKVVAVAVDAAVVAVPIDAAPPEVAKVDELVSRFHAALAHAKPADLGLLFETKAFAFGVEAHEVAEGRDAIVAMVRHDLGTPPARGFEVSTRFALIGHDGDVGWFAEELRVGAHTFVTTVVAGLRDGAWTIGALQFATTMANDVAYKLARDNELAVPDAIPDAHDDSPLATAMRTGFASKPSFVEARSTRPEAFNFGSAPGERIAGGEAIKKTFARIKSALHLHDAVKVGMIGDRGGWGAANVDFTDTDRDGTDITQTFRVLAAWVHEDAGWRMVQTQWSNAR